MIPKHVAIIMDGNGRWAKNQGLKRMLGHRKGAVAIRETLNAAADIGIKYVTLYAFSTENWDRPKEEVGGLMSLMVTVIGREISDLVKNNVKVSYIGNIKKLPEKTFKSLDSLREKTKNNDGVNLVLAINYSGRVDLVEGMRSICEKVKIGELSSDNLDADTISRHLSTSGIPDPDLLIRTSGESRLSNFLLWELAYSELLFIDKLWPDFRKEDLLSAVEEFKKRDRRFGKISEQK